MSDSIIDQAIRAINGGRHIDAIRLLQDWESTTKAWGTARELAAYERGVEAEREACAQICEQAIERYETGPLWNTTDSIQRVRAIKDCIKLIRERSKQ